MDVTHVRYTFLHMNWAAARVWKAVVASQRAVSDEYILDTLMHIHETQRAFLDVWLGQPFERRNRSDIGSTKQLCEWAESIHSSALEYVESLSDSDLPSGAVLPWAKYFAKSLGREPIGTTLGETLHQVVSHSMHHRGQVARRIRELDETPPLTDYIVWVWSGRPEAEWPNF